MPNYIFAPPQGGGGGVGGRSINYFLKGNAYANDPVATFIAPQDLSVKYVTLSATTAPVGASLLADVTVNGVSIFTSAANKPTLASGIATNTTPKPDNTRIKKGDQVSFVINQVGSTTPGADILCAVICQ